MLCVEFPQVQYIDVSETLRILKAVAILSSKDLKLSTIFAVSHLLSAIRCPCSGPREIAPFPLNRGVPSIEVKNTKIMGTFSGTKFYVL